MPSQVRVVRQRNSSRWDDLIRDVIQGQRHGTEHDYFGVTNQDRADAVRRALRTAGKHLGVSVKAFWKPCPSPGKCSTGGGDCQYHVYYTCYDLEIARQYKAGQANNNGK